ncbi:uncharacterized protein LOC113231863 [Hyposmocoma kahamanoa]|uniref:uncharacterized protein LOC113231863 n=1 Tax=Hyposmocoma kahamanoa TaxID=1477025 RepID=UPI000E6D876D|nr:uncharacterized protein LOC113231863 [Hyposmocoma kahamanoa]
MRNTWLKLANKEPDSFSTESNIYFCEDHFDLENDMENYTRYKIMGSVKRIRMKPSCIPSRFDCQTARKRKPTPPTDEHAMQQHASKRTALVPVSGDIQIQSIEMPISLFHKELLSEEDAIPTCTSHEKEFHDKAVQVVQHNIQFCDQAVQVQPLHEHVSCQVVQHRAHKLIQACVAKHYRSKQVQFNVAVKDTVSSPIQLFAHQSTSTSPNKPSMSGHSSTRRKLIFAEEKYDSDVSYTLSQEGSTFDSSPSKPSSQTTEDSSQEKIIKDQKLNLQSTLSKIKKNPRMYIGIPAELYFIVDIISKHTQQSENHILLCLVKIRLNRTFSQLADDFDISLSQFGTKIFHFRPKVKVNKQKKLLASEFMWKE